ncbi:MAG: trypsin-like peptidase domain-containing protein [Firmicutes bacterium]|nr:trypsin-like peptidase domain-containing protein [Bacillota bacterium]
MKKQLPVILLMVLLGSLLGSYFTYSWYIQKTNPVQAEPKKSEVYPVSPGDKSTRDNSLIGTTAVEDAAAKLGPSVVFITTKAVVEPQESSMMMPGMPKDLKDRFFFFDPYEDYNYGPKERTGSGSGIIISEDGYILTNQHVIENATQIKVKFDPTPDSSKDSSKTYDAKVIGEDRLTDVAILKIEAKNLPAATLGDSDKLKVGEWVVAVGNPLGYEHTVTVGVLSAKGRNLPFYDREYPNLLQTDAAINPGNSGGPLANLKGEVIGMNTVVSSQGQGIGFAIPVNRIKKIKDELIVKGRVIRPFIGIQMLPMDEAKAEYLGMPKVEGVMVFQVFDNTPASDAKLVRGDVILEMDGKKINNPDELQKQIRELKVGQTVKLKIWRNKSFADVNLRVAEMPSPESLKNRSK